MFRENRFHMRRRLYTVWNISPPWCAMVMGFLANFPIDFDYGQSPSSFLLLSDHEIIFPAIRSFGWVWKWRFTSASMPVSICWLADEIFHGVKLSFLTFIGKIFAMEWVFSHLRGYLLDCWELKRKKKTEKIQRACNLHVTYQRDYETSNVLIYHVFILHSNE